MAETVKEDNSAEKANNLSDKKIEERADKALDRFKETLNQYFSE